MTVVNKANVPPPALPKQVVDVPELGGEVIVRGLLLSDRLAVYRKAKTDDLFISDLLACTVVDSENEPIYTKEQWEEFGSSNFNQSLKLYKVAKELSGLDAEVNEKK